MVAGSPLPRFCVAGGCTGVIWGCPCCANIACSNATCATGSYLHAVMVESGLGAAVWHSGGAAPSRANR
eukprot:5472938-Amphidinium_carterae.1